MAPKTKKMSSFICVSVYGKCVRKRAQGDKMKGKKIVVFWAVLGFAGCAVQPPEYESPVLIAPATGASFSENVVFEWNPRNKADWTTGDYVFTLQVSKSTDFSAPVYAYSAKVWNMHDAAVYNLRNGVYFWRVVATYTQSSGGEKHVLASDVRQFTYTGNDGAIFVNAAAPAGGNGTQAAPVKTIGEGIFTAGKRQVTTVRVANGAYAETIGTTFTGSIKGCYDPTTWARDTGTCATTLSDAAAATYYGLVN